MEWCPKNPISLSFLTFPYLFQYDCTWTSAGCIFARRLRRGQTPQKSARRRGHILERTDMLKSKNHSWLWVKTLGHPPNRFNRWGAIKPHSFIGFEHCSCVLTQLFDPSLDELWRHVLRNELATSNSSKRNVKRLDGWLAKKTNPHNITWSPLSKSTWNPQRGTKPNNDH